MITSRRWRPFMTRSVFQLGYMAFLCQVQPSWTVNHDWTSTVNNTESRWLYWNMGPHRSRRLQFEGKCWENIRFKGQKLDLIFNWEFNLVWFFVLSLFSSMHWKIRLENFRIVELIVFLTFWQGWLLWW